MIASVRGEVLDIALDHVVVETAGIGYRINATPATLGTLTRGRDVRLMTAMIVREDSMTLYGFADADARELFGVLQTVTGIGPRLAMAVLSVLDPNQLRRALVDGDHATLTRVPGIGKRVAERLVVELRDKVTVTAEPGGPLTTLAGSGPVREQIVDALVGLGFAAKAAEQSTDTVLAQTPDAPTATALRAALALLGKTR